MSDLLNCPFCGGAGEFASHDQNTNLTSVGCFNCGVTAETQYLPKEQAIAAWNRRPDPAPVGVRVPEEMHIPYGDPELHANWQENGYACGWNGCRQALIDSMQIHRGGASSVISEMREVAAGWHGANPQQLSALADRLEQSLNPQPGAVVDEVIVGQLADWYREHQSRHGYRIQAPGHAHLRPGFWDDDNGKLASKPCALCRLWETARAAATLTNTDKGPNDGR